VPLYEKTPQKHEPGCWRWSSHWRCAVKLVDELADTVDTLMEDLLGTGTDWEQYHQDITAADALVVRVRTEPTNDTALPQTKLFSFGKRR
jgi:hypothetical protein